MSKTEKEFLEELFKTAKTFSSEGINEKFIIKIIRAMKEEVVGTYSKKELKVNNLNHQFYTILNEKYGDSKYNEL